MKQDPVDNKDEEIMIDALSPYLRAYDMAPIHRISKKISRNEICPYSNVKFKRCCGKDGKNFCPRMIQEYIDNLK
ncbi:MAG: hypothetical protein EBU90_13725 [Proteobacteria bacterium]|nr:hypothetical protein [Pseudomonadota bacterium]